MRPGPIQTNNVNNTEKLKALDALYATLPKVDCQQKCQACCATFGMSGLEKRRLEAAGGAIKTKRVMCFAENPVGGPGAPIGVHEVVKGQCPRLVDGRCSVYQIRPMVCRIWGTTKAFTCPFGCQPERWLSDAEVFALMCRVQELTA